jgi:hypothetical protein
LENRNYISIQDFQAPWTECPNCNQDYHGPLRDELSGKFKEFAENQYPEFDWRRLVAYLQVLWSNVGYCDELISKSIAICNKLENGEFDPLLIDPVDIKRLVSMTYYGIGVNQTYLGIRNNDEKSSKKGIRHIKKARDTLKEAGDTSGALRLEAEINSSTSECIETFGPGFGKTATTEESLENFRAIHESCIDQHGEASANAICCGEDYAIALLGYD